MFTLVLHDEAAEEVKALPLPMRAKLDYLMAKLKTNPTALREPHSKPVRDGIFELRTMGGDIARGLYAYRKGQTIYLLRVFVKKTQKTPNSEIEIAKRRLEEMTNAKS